MGFLLLLSMLLPLSRDISLSASAIAQPARCRPSPFVGEG